MAEQRERDFMTVNIRGGVVFEPTRIGNGVKLRVCVSRGKKNRTTGQYDNTDTYINVLVWQPQLINYAASLQKRAKVFVEGAVLEENNFTDKEGNPRSEWQASLPPWPTPDHDIDRQLGTFGAKEPSVSCTPPRGLVPLSTDEIPF